MADETTSFEPEDAQPRARLIRVFISSTFCDMQVEREVLVKKVFPQLRKLCDERGVVFTDVDLRWGITEEQADRGEVLPICIAEIDRCRPFFIGLLGERYGWVPDDLPQKLIDQQPWLEEHRHKSVTELEIIHGVLSNPPMANRACFYFRDPAYVDQIPNERRANHLEQDAVARDKLKALKERIRSSEVACRYDYPDPETLGEWVLRDLTTAINQEFPPKSKPDSLDQERALHEAYANSRRLAFVGREELLRQIDEYCASPSKPVVITGECGCGKSSLLAEWVARWRENHPSDVIIQHHVGSTPDSADWQRLVCRILGELKRAFSINDDIPMQTNDLRGALNDWTAKAAGSRRVVLLLDALNQLADDGVTRQLGWLPDVFPANFCVLVSSLPGECLNVLQKRGCSELNVPLFALSDIAPAALAYFRVFGKTPPSEIVTRLESTPPARNAIYLAPVLDELRQFGKHDDLDAKAAEYLSARDLPQLFDRILDRWHHDFGEDPKHPDLVRRSLCLISCARFGLTEVELLQLLGERGQPLSRGPWTPLYLAAENALTSRTGLLHFGNEYLRAAVEGRWLNDVETVRAFRLQLAEYFTNASEPTDRELDELPTLLCDLQEWGKLKDLLATIPTFLRLRSSQRWKWELQQFWIRLRQIFSPAEVYREALSGYEEANDDEERHSDVLRELGAFHVDAGNIAEAEPLFRRALGACARVFGLHHPATVQNLQNLAFLLLHQGNYTGAEPLFRRSLEANEAILGPTHPATMACVHNLAAALSKMGRLAEAEPLCRRAVEGLKQTHGLDHLDTLSSTNSLAGIMESKADYVQAEQLYTQSLESFKRVLGPRHPHTLMNQGNLATLLMGKGDYEGAEPLYREAFEGLEAVLGPEHPDTLVSMNSLALLLSKTGDLEGSEQMNRRALRGFEQTLGPDHPTTLTSVNAIAGLLEQRGDVEGAEAMFQQALNGRRRVLGIEHVSTLTSANNLACLLLRKSDYSRAEPLCHDTLEQLERVLGPAHPDTLTSVVTLAYLLAVRGDYAAAEPLCRRALEGFMKLSVAMGRDHPSLQASTGNYVAVLQGLGFGQTKILAELNAVSKPLGIQFGDSSKQ